jgi:hypothetical protein
VDHRVHAADVVHLIGEPPGLGCAAEIADDDSCRMRGEVGDSRNAPPAAGMQDNVMARIDEDDGDGAAEPVGGAGDENARQR